MGACSLYLNLDGKLTPSQVKQKVMAVIAESRAETNDSYSGDWNTIDSVHIIDQTFQTKDEASKYCHKQGDKGEAFAVKYVSRNEAAVDSNPTVVKLKQQLLDAQVKNDKLTRDIYDNIKKAKSKTISCDQCESRVNRSYLRSCACPVCGSDLRSNTDRDKIKKSLDKIKSVNTKLNQARNKLLQKDKSEKLLWLVFAMASM